MLYRARIYINLSLTFSVAHTCIHTYTSLWMSLYITVRVNRLSTLIDFLIYFYQEVDFFSSHNVWNFNIHSFFFCPKIKKSSTCNNCERSCRLFGGFFSATRDSQKWCNFDRSNNSKGTEGIYSASDLCCWMSTEI